MSKHFKGIMVPVMTPFDNDGNILIDELRRHLLFLMENGVHSVLVPSGTGEFANLTTAQKKVVIEVAVETVGGKIPVVSLISDCSTANVLELLEVAVSAGATEVMVTPPYYSHIDQRALIAFFTKVADASSVPVWLYHQPGETKLSIDPQTVQHLSSHPNIIGVKAAAGFDFYYFCHLRQLLRGNDSFSVLMGEDFFTLSSYVLGGDGSVSSLANIAPAEFVKLFDAWNNNDLDTARVLHERIMDLFSTFVMVDSGAYQSACKVALREMGIYSTNYVSSPFLPILPEEEQSIIEQVRSLGFSSNK